MLRFGQSDYQTVQIILEDYLTRQSGIILKFRNQIEHVFFAVTALAGTRHPGWIDIDVAGGARAIAAAIAIDAVDTVVGGSSHQGGARGHVQARDFAAESFEYDLGHFNSICYVLSAGADQPQKATLVIPIWAVNLLKGQQWRLICQEGLR
jgi:hypothetical protein